MDIADCDCPCHCDPEYARLKPSECQQCNGTGRVIVGSAVIDAVREVEAEAAADTFRRRPVDHKAPPCCHTPQLCGGPHEDCYEASAPDGCGQCTPTKACDNPRAGCYVHVPGYTDTDDFTPGGTYACPGPERCTDFDCHCG